MKKFTKIILLFIVGIVVADVSAKNPIPPDPDLILDSLPNGLTYYIRHNESPKGLVDFYIAQKTGSVNEEDQQRGLAHFLEHMCFNGTEHFPGNSLIAYLESIGVRFGTNLNAYTSTDETVYNICEVPAIRENTLDSCLLILRDWSCALSLEPSEIDKERGVIKGEWRQRNGNPATRLLEKSLPIVYPGSRYGERMPIGKMEIIDNFDYQQLRDYYEKWYRPENQAIIVVGDIDPEIVRHKIISLFGTIPKSIESTKSPVYSVPDNQELIVCVRTDPEQQNSMLQLYIKHPDLTPAEKVTIDGLREIYVEEIVAAMLAERFDELEQEPEASFSNLGTGDTRFILSRQPRAWIVRATARQGKENLCIKVFAEEIARAAQYGFTQTELDRAKLDYRTALDSRYVNREKIENTNYARRYVKHFLEGGAIPAEEPYYKMMKGVMSSVKLDDINSWFATLAGDNKKNHVITAYLPAGTEGVSEQSLSSAFLSVKPEELQPYTDSAILSPLLSDLPSRGKVVSEEFIQKFNAKKWILSNGAKVYLHKNTDTPDKILIQAYSPGGISQHYNPAKAPDYLVINDLLAVSGFGDHTSSDLRKHLVGKKADVKLDVEEMEDRLAVATSPTDLETALMMIHLKTTSLRKDDKAFATFLANQKMKLSSHTSNPTFEMGDSIHANVYAHHPLGMRLRLADLEKINYDSVISIGRKRFADMSDFSFFISGNFDEDSLRNLIEIYIASLPGTGSKEKPQDIGYRYATGYNTQTYSRPMETPASIIYFLYTGDAPYDIATLVKSRALGRIISDKLRIDIREDKGWTYGVRTHIGLNPAMNGEDSPKFLMPVYIRVEPGKEDECMEIIGETVKKLSNPGFITHREVAAAREYLLKNANDRETDNGYWNSIMHAYDKFGCDMHTDFEKEAESLSPGTLAEFADILFKNANITRLVMKPE